MARELHLNRAHKRQPTFLATLVLSLELDQPALRLIKTLELIQSKTRQLYYHKSLRKMQLNEHIFFVFVLYFHTIKNSYF